LPALTYSFTVPNGQYQLRLHFAEIFTGAYAVGRRVFDVLVENTLVLDNLDIFARAGANTPLIESIPVTIANGQLNLQFLHVVENPKISAIELIALAPPPSADTLPPSMPGNLASSNVTATSLSLTWSAATDNVAVTGYRILRDNVLLTTVAGTSFNDTGLTPSTLYAYQVIAMDAAGNASIPAPLSVSTLALPDTLAPSTPTGLTASAITTSSLSLAWTASADNVAVTDYQVRRGGILLATVTSPSFADSGLSPATLYTYQVVALDAAGNASAPAELQVSAPPPPADTLPPSTPGDLASSNLTATSLSLTWSAATDNVAVTGYRILRDSVLLTTVAGTSFNDTGLTPSTLYAYQVIAVDAAGNASLPAPLSSTPALPDTLPPSTPAGLAASAITTTSLSLAWTASTDNVAVTGYQVRRGGVLLTTVTSPSFADSGLSPATLYTYQVVALDAAGNTSAPASLSVSTAAGSGTTVLRINAGGGNFVDSSGNTWSADSGSTPASTPDRPIPAPSPSMARSTTPCIRPNATTSRRYRP